MNDTLNHESVKLVHVERGPISQKNFQEQVHQLHRLRLDTVTITCVESPASDHDLGDPQQKCHIHPQSRP